MNKKLLASKEERARMDEIDQRQQDAIETLSTRVDTLVWAIFLVNFIWGTTVIFMWLSK
jgi:hypothetical protein